MCAQVATDAALNRNGSSTTEPTATAHARSTGQVALTETQFRAKVRLVANLGKIQRSVVQSTATRSGDSDESSTQPPDVAQGGETDRSSFFGPSARTTAQQFKVTGA